MIFQYSLFDVMRIP